MNDHESETAIPTQKNSSSNSSNNNNLFLPAAIISWNGTRDRNSFSIQGNSQKIQINRFSTKYLVTGVLTLRVPEFNKIDHRTGTTVVLKDLKRNLPFDYTVNLNSSPGCKLYKKRLLNQFKDGDNLLINMISRYYEIPASKNCTGAIFAKTNPNNRLNLIYNGNRFRRGRIQFRSNKRRTLIKIFHDVSDLATFRMFYGMRPDQRFYKKCSNDSRNLMFRISL